MGRTPAASCSAQKEKEKQIRESKRHGEALALDVAGKMKRSRSARRVRCLATTSQDLSNKPIKSYSI